MTLPPPRRLADAARPALAAAALALGAALALAAAPPAAKPKGQADEMLEIASWKLRVLVPQAAQCYRASEAREDPEKVNGATCVAFDMEGETPQDGYPLLVGQLGGPTDMGGWRAIAFSYKVLVRSAEKAPNLQFELHEAAGGPKGSIHGFKSMLMDDQWQEVEVPLSSMKESYSWDLGNVGAIALAPRFPAGIHAGLKVDVTFKFGGFRLVK